MEGELKSNAKCSLNKFFKKDSLVIFAMSLVLFVLMIVRIEVVRRRAEVMESKLEKRIQRIEEEMQVKVQTIVKEMLQTERNPTTRDSRNYASLETAEGVPGQHRRERRNVTPTPGAISLQQIRQEIDRKFTQACTSADKLCQTGQQGPQGEPGTPGYPGYKGEKGAPGKPGPRGPLGLAGTQGIRGKQGPTGPQGVKGEKGEVGAVGSPGAKGDTGLMGPPGNKGSVGFKGNKGNRGFTGIQGPKGECSVPPKIFVSPGSQYVFANKPATFYCWVQGQLSKKITWRKLGGTLHSDISTQDGVLHINNAQKSHIGSYLCTVLTSYGIFRAVTILGIKELPILEKKPPFSVFADIGSTVKLCCQADASLAWSRAGTTTPTSLASSQQGGCLVISDLRKESAGKYTCRATNQFGFADATTEVIATVGVANSWCTGESQSFKVYCRTGWMLIARFSNRDSKNWMNDYGAWWYDRLTAVGAITDPSVNADMISSAFWMVSGRDFKITRSDDPSHTALLQTTGNCLGGKTFRSKITSYGDFRNGKVWSSERCLGSCTVQYGGQYMTTDGFQQASCSSNIQSSNKIGFWCDFTTGDGSVMMIGGGGKNCNRADHGIGITETNEASFVEVGGSETEYDFGYEAMKGTAPSQSYSLNLWIR